MIRITGSLTEAVKAASDDSTVDVVGTYANLANATREQVFSALDSLKKSYEDKQEVWPDGYAFANTLLRDFLASNPANTNEQKRKLKVGELKEIQTPVDGDGNDTTSFNTAFSQHWKGGSEPYLSLDKSATPLDTALKSLQSVDDTQLKIQNTAKEGLDNLKKAADNATSKLILFGVIGLILYAKFSGRVGA